MGDGWRRGQGEGKRYVHCWRPAQGSSRTAPLTADHHSPRPLCPAPHTTSALPSRPSVGIRVCAHSSVCSLWHPRSHLCSLLDSRCGNPPACVTHPLDGLTQHSNQCVWGRVPPTWPLGFSVSGNQLHPCGHSGHNPGALRESTLSHPPLLHTPGL